MIKNQKGNTAVLSVIFVGLLLILTGVAVYFWQNYEKQKAITELKESMMAQNTVINSSNQVDTKSPTKDSSIVVDTKLKLPVVVYTPNGLFTGDEIAEIQKKYVNPFIDWNTDNKITTVSITVEEPYPAIPNYKYKFTYINDGGGNGGFLFGTTTPLEWWMPECMGGCNFSESFKAKYPEIVAKSK